MYPLVVVVLGSAQFWSACLVAQTSVSTEAAIQEATNVGLLYYSESLQRAQYAKSQNMETTWTCWTYMDQS